MRYSRERPTAFLYDIVFDARGRRAVGFKLKTDEAFDPRQPHINRAHDVIAADRDIKILRLRRDDLLAQYISHQVLLRQTRQPMVYVGQERPEVIPFRADPGEVVRYLLDVGFREGRADRAFAGHRQLRLRYEQLESGDEAVRARLLDFLGLDHAELTTDTQRVLPGSRRLLENLDEVVSALATAGFPDGRYPAA